MAPATRSRRPLPRRVYWFRRLMVVGVAFALVFGIAQLLDYSTDGSGGEQATSVSAAPDRSDAPESTRPGPRKRKPGKKPKDKQEEKDQLARPDGPCDDSDILVTPTVTDANAGSPVKIVLEVTTVKAAACFWEVSPETVFLNIDGEEGTLWSSQQCPSAVPTKSVVPRRERAATVKMWWNSKESDEGCPSWTPWVHQAGSYTAVAAARGSVTPVATGFYLGSPVAPTVTETATPTPTPSDKPSGRQRPSDKQSDKPEPSDEPSDTSTGRPKDDQDR